MISRTDSGGRLVVDYPDGESYRLAAVADAGMVVVSVGRVSHSGTTVCLDDAASDALLLMLVQARIDAKRQRLEATTPPLLPADSPAGTPP